ncbi:hypothetical protein E2C01_003378 [Portunus trituberculatus]|uniref:Uncharacterized protein n=1 Tax=Portunus trituberculatus TaxID=210409 RepID=A0A5B7CNQ3_PORTR|nr:hypothetical protein [Portunus trituberculatus]
MTSTTLNCCHHNSQPLPTITLTTTLTTTITTTLTTTDACFPGSSHLMSSPTDEPLEVKDLKCISHNWESFSCHWNLSDNPVQEEEYVPYLISTE